MMRCKDVRDRLALNPADEDLDLQAHMDDCSDCATYRHAHEAFDVVVRAEMRWVTPAALTASLLALTVPAALVQPLRARPRGWYVTLVYVLTLAVIGLSLMIAWQIVGILFSQFGVQQVLAQISAMPAEALTQLTQALPASRWAIDVFLQVRTQLLWLLLAAVLWAVVDKWNPSLQFGRRQISS